MQVISCPSCGHENVGESASCERCGFRLVLSCPGCGTNLRPTARFCDSCGQPVLGDLRSYTPRHLAARILAGGRSHEGEHKQVTVLFADVKGSMDLAERMDPEIWHEIMDRFFTLLCAGVQRYEGTVCQFTGDGIMALFGAPIEHEDHARRACHAALDVTGELAAYAAELRDAQGLDFSVRLGLNSGELVLGSIGEDLRVAYTTVGHSVGLAKRMEQLAAPGSAYLTEQTASLVQGWFEFDDLGRVEVKGVREPLRIYKLRGLGAARTALEIARARGLSRFVGRGEELSALESALERALQGNGQVVGVVSEPGVGKSRLAFEFGERCRARGTFVYEAHAMPHGKTIPFLFALEMLRGYLGVSERDSEDAAREKVTTTLLSLDGAFEEDLALLLEFLGVPDPERPALQVDPEARQERLLGLVKRLVHMRGRRQPAVWTIEDLHWIDPGSELFLEALVEAVHGTRMLVLVTLRPEYDAEWMRCSCYEQLSLPPLDPEATDELLDDLLGGDSSIDGLAELIRQRTAGNAFFIEEIVRALVESGSIEGKRGAYRLVRPIDEVTVPATVQAVIGGRIDRLPDLAKGLLQTAAVIGERFPEGVLRQVSELSEVELAEALRALIVAEFLYEGMLSPAELDYTFNHPLTQEVAYGSQLSRRRARIHAVVAGALADFYSERLDERAALIAHHWEAAREPLEAARWNRRAGEWAGVMHLGESMRSWRNVVALAGAAPESRETMGLGQIARLWILGLGWRLGMSAEEAEAIVADGKAAAERSGDLTSLALLNVPYGIILAGAGGVERYVELCFEACRLADESGVRTVQLEARSMLYGLWLNGRLGECLTVAEEGIELTGGDPTMGMSFGSLRSRLAYFTWFRGLVLASIGRLDEAASEIERAIRIAGEKGDIEIVCRGWNAQVWLARYTGEVHLARDRGRQAVELAEAIGSPFTLVHSYEVLGLAHLLNGEWSEARGACEHARGIVLERGANREFMPRMLASHAEAYLGTGDIAAARQTAEEAVQVARDGRLRLFEVGAELTLGRVLLRTGGARDGAAEAVLAHALVLAGQIEARSEEPLIRLELAELAGLMGNEVARRHELQEAHRLFSEVGATARAEQTTRQLDVLMSAST